ncbi:PaaI family thioesterase [Streptomyces sp. HNM0663]|uniref:PaaI family thioesterase n=1 Tax=Streptomyces chengmaiensis TaxID=3040919 RepID=A0ABT6HX99_9ACTN|nr:PaaI family thioesterase [Streptomyces chengmaiensis]MDH2393315.1 PaaI family thioesterase [Streptomyces chengmaiensis]
MTSTPAPALTPEDAQKVLADNFAPWVLDLGLVVVETGERHAVLRLPWSERLAREGGALSGQALMAAADTATVIAVASARGGFTPMTTVQQSSSFLRAVQGSDVLLDARIGKLGRRMAFADITMTAEDAAGADGPAARASTVYALLG